MQQLHSVITGGQSDYALRLARSKTWLDKARVAEYQNDDYLRRLNHLLQAELGAAHIYHTYQKIERASWSCDHNLRSHRLAARMLVKLITKNQGVPEADSFNLTTTLSQAAVQVSRIMPDWLGNYTAMTTCEQLEKWFLHRYEALLARAPSWDQPVIHRLIEGSSLNIKYLSDRHDGSL